jgi:hypothetical protein
MAQELKEGDKVEWNTPQGKTRGMIKEKLTSRTEDGGQTVAASKDDPRYLVESEKCGKEAVHPDQSLKEFMFLRVPVLGRYFARLPLFTELP